MLKVIKFTCKMKGLQVMKKLFRNISIMFSLLLFTFGTVYVSNKVEGIDPGVIHSKDFYDRNFNN